MNVQEACETLEELLQKDIKNSSLNNKEFIALNLILLEAAMKLNYKVPDRCI